MPLYEIIYKSTGEVFLSGAFSLHHSFHKDSHPLRCLFLHLPGGVGVGTQGEPGSDVAQHGGHRLYIHAIL